MSMKTYAWFPTECSVPDHMMEIVLGEYSTRDGEKIPMARNVIINSEWGIPNSMYLQGDEQKGIPREIKITWYSYSEDAFYELHEQLPDLSIYFEKGLYDGFSASFVPVNTICLGMAPGGQVNVWLQNMDQSVLLVSYRGKLVELEWSTTMDVEVSKEEFIKEVRSDNRLGIPSYTEQEISIFNRLTGIDIEFHMKGATGPLVIQHYNGEKKRYALSQLKCSITAAGPIQQMDLSVSTDQGARRIVLDMDKEEMLDAYAKCMEGLLFNAYINIFTNEVKLDVHCGDRTATLSHFKSAVFLDEH